MITSYLAKKYDRMLNYYISQPIEECLDPLPTTTFIRYLELLYQLDDKETIKNKYKMSLSRMMIKEFANPQSYKPLCINEFGCKALLENAKDKDSLLSVNKTHGSSSFNRSQSEIEIHDIYAPDFTFDSEIKNQKWLESSFLLSQYDPFCESISYISICTSDTYRTFSSNEMILQTLQMLNSHNSTHIMDRKKTLKPGISNSVVLATEPQRCIKKMRSYANIGLKSVLPKGGEQNTCQRGDKKDDLRNNNKKRNYLVDKSEIREEKSRPPAKAPKYQFTKDYDLKGKMSKKVLPIKRIKEATFKQYQSVAIFERCKGPTNNVDPLVNPRGSKTKIPTYQPPKKYGQIINNRPSTKISQNLINNRRSVSKNHLNNNKQPPFVNSRVNYGKALNSNTNKGTLTKKTDRKIIKSCDKPGMLVKDDFLSLFQKTEKINSKAKRIVHKPVKTAKEPKKTFKDIRNLFWKNLNLELK